MQNKCKAILLGILCLMGACGQNQDKKADVSYAIPDADGKGRLVYVVFPLNVCDNCTNNGKKFAKKYPSSSQIKVVFTNLSDEKRTRLTMGDTLYNDNKLILDRKNKWIEAGLLTSFAPTAFFVDDGEIERKKEIDLHNLELVYEEAAAYVSMKEATGR